MYIYLIVLLCVIRYSSDDADFISLELLNGYPKLRMNLGQGEVELNINGRDRNGVRTLASLNDGKWHQIMVYKTGRVS